MFPKITHQIRDNRIVQLLAISLLTILTYYGVWNAFFTSDDFWMLGWVRHLPSLGDAIWAQYGYGLRLMLDFSMWARVRLFDLNPAPYYWISIATHLISAFIIYGLVLYWTRRMSVAFLAALFFATTFSHYTVITWITGSEYSQATILFLLTLTFFALYLEGRSVGWYLASLLTYILLLLFLELVLSLPLVLVAYHLTLGRGNRPLRSLGWRDVRVQLPYWVLFGIYLLFQFNFVQIGSSEATVAQESYGPGLHMLSNLYYLAYLVIPNVHYAVLESYFGAGFLPIIEAVTLVTAVAINLLAIYGLWKGSTLVRFSILSIYLTFLPYTLWHGRFAGAIRYLYLPSIGFSILLALFLVYLYDLLQLRTNPRLKVLVPLITLAILAVNAAVIQTWVQRHVNNSTLRRNVVATLVDQYSNMEIGTTILIEVPAAKYLDLGSSCDLVISGEVHCEAFVTGTISVEEKFEEHQNQPVIWLKSTPEGIRQVYP